MFSPPRRTWLALAALGLLFAAPARAAETPKVAPQVIDEAKLFKAATVKEANAVISAILRDHDKDLFIETFPGIPADRQATFNKVKDDKDRRQAFFREWARNRAYDAKTHGVYVLIVKSPGHVQVETGNETQKKAFTLKERDRLSETMLADFRQKKWDKGLLDGVEYVRKTMDENLKGQKKSQQPTAPAPGRHQEPTVGPRPSLFSGLWGWVCVGLVVLAVVWVAFAVIRWLGRGGAGYGPGGGYGPAGGYGPGYGGGGFGGGGGFLSGMLGGLFGAAAGSWVYDRFFRGGGYGGGAAPTSEPSQAAPERQDTDYSGTGGDFGDNDDGDTGGGDSGGDAGDAGGDTGDGGGDFGGDTGGDFGGGGGDFGGDTGGGGDF